MAARYPRDTKEEFDAVDKVRGILNKLDVIPCTACRYCIDGCPKHISIPDLFACYNAKKQYNSFNSAFYYGVHTKEKGKEPTLEEIAKDVASMFEN